ncbi:Gfo/Idh/MocA family protein [Thiovibrio frasassiensis]|jgi:predicted dehydrogenase|uniref:Gfo/Idh/MocA family oxidoreductase n=1 Tax=Thiovibrio frasassiensis TaxID=2984131 RepID=A0A9X4RMH1_9BACT|nr:Gfo/Idh/MocA family oxidoreductase [Thiovibrio frasassiensis]MDG4476769.1 Gfo/Idh/MocA family oxidoreductase [Thiovibrio frasassiensis]
MTQTRIGVIGVGYLGKFHAQKYMANPEVELVGVADANPASAAEVAQFCNTTAFADYQQLLDKVDAVSVVVPTSLHHEVARRCLLAGVDVMLEKPMTTTLAEADELIALADEKQRILQVGHIERYNPALLAMQKHLTQPLFIESHRIHVFKPRGLDVNVVLDLMIHDIDIILSLVKSPIASMHAVGMEVFTQTTDIANVRLIFENGCTANLTVSRVSRENIRRLRIFQPHSFLAVDFGKKEITVIKPKKELDANNMPQEEVISSCYLHQDALEMELTDFVKNVRNRTQPMVSGREGRLALAVAQEIMARITEHVAAHPQLFNV